MVELIERMQPEDRQVCVVFTTLNLELEPSKSILGVHMKALQTFDFDLRQLDWTDFISDVLFGMKTFLTKNDIMSDEKLARARRKVRM